MAWIGDNALALLEAAAVVVGLVFTAYSVRRIAQTREAPFVADVVRDHRAIWTQAIEKPELSRVLQRDVDLEKSPVTESEKLFVNLIIMHLTATLNAVDKGVLAMPYATQRDLRAFFSLPIPDSVWRENENYRSPRLRSLVNSTQRPSNLRN